MWGVGQALSTPGWCCPARAAVLQARPRPMPGRLGDSLAVELPALTRAALVRIQVPQPPHPNPLTTQRFPARPAPRGRSCLLRSHNAPTSRESEGSITGADACPGSGVARWRSAFARAGSGTRRVERRTPDAPSLPFGPRPAKSSPWPLTRLASCPNEPPHGCARYAMQRRSAPRPGQAAMEHMLEQTARAGPRLRQRRLSRSGSRARPARDR